MEKTATSFEEFWPEYVRAHQSKTNRTLHAIGIGLALACVVAAIFKKRPSLLLLAPILAYGFAWCGHFFAEKNMPATFSHPLYSAKAGLLMFWKTISGDMEAEVARVLEDFEREAPPVSRPVPAEAVN
jgi:hypothetical protein